MAYNRPQRGVVLYLRCRNVTMRACVRACACIHPAKLSRRERDTRFLHSSAPLSVPFRHGPASLIRTMPSFPPPVPTSESNFGFPCEVSRKWTCRWEKSVTTARCASLIPSISDNPFDRPLDIDGTRGLLKMKHQRNFYRQFAGRQLNLWGVRAICPESSRHFRRELRATGCRAGIIKLDWA